MLPLVSVVTPSFNQAQFLEQTLCSVLEQNYANLEYYVVDGGSRDDSLAIIKKFSDRLTGWVSEPDQGQGHAIQKGFARANGKYIAWLNSDDYYLPGMLQTAVNALEENPEWGLVYGDVQAVDMWGKQTGLLRYAAWQLTDLMQFKIIGQPSVVMRREVYEQAGGISGEYHYLLDHHLWLKMAALRPMGYIAQPLAAARFHRDAKNVAMSAAFAQEAELIAGWMETVEPYKQYLQLNRTRVWAGAYRFGARYLSEGCQYRDALKMYQKAWKNDPAVVLRDWKRLGVTILGRWGFWR